LLITCVAIVLAVAVLIDVVRTPSDVLGVQKDTDAAALAASHAPEQDATGWQGATPLSK